MDKLKMQSPNLVEANIDKIAELFPNCITESRDEQDVICRAVDFDLLRQELSPVLVEGSQERYHLNWPGKREALLTANAPIAKTLRPCREESVDFDNTKNIFIEGDNLDALKLLQETYLGQVKMIYIDPPYNTGTNLIYKNDFSESQNDFFIRSGQASDAGGKLVANMESNGRFHSDWLSMMYSRIKIAKNLLASDGILVCAIDENEFATLSLVFKEIFGEGGYCHDYVSIVHNPRGQQGTNFSYVNEYLLFIYPSDKKKYLADFPKNEVDSRNLRDSGTESDRTDARNCFYPFIVKDGKIIDIGDVPEDLFHPASANVKRNDGLIEVWPLTDEGKEKKWRYARQSVPKILHKLEPKFGRDSLQIIFNKDTGTMRSVWVNPRYDSSEYGTKLLEDLIEGSGFTFPKSLWAVYDCVFAATEADKNGLVMDFFSGSATTAQAVMELNVADSGSRKFIMVQVPEGCNVESEPYMNGYHNIAEIGKERIRRAGKKIKEENPLTTQNLDIGFRVFKVDTSNMKDVYYTPDALKQENLELFKDHIKPDRTPEDLLFQVLIDWGIDLTLPVELKAIDEKTIFIVDTNVLLACFDKGITEGFVKKLAAYKPLRVVFRDDAFDSDAVKINVEQIFKLLSPGTEVKSI